MEHKLFKPKKNLLFKDAYILLILISSSLILM